MRLNPLNLVAVILGGLAWPAVAQTVPEPGEWREIPGTELRAHVPTNDEIGAERGNLPGHVNPWIGFAYNSEERRWLNIRPGGHRDYGGQDSYAFDFDAWQWSRVEPLQELTEANPEQPSSTCRWPAHGPPSFHTYDGVEHIEGSRYIFLGFEPYCHRENHPKHAYAYEVDTATTPWTWTPLPQLDGAAGLAATAVHGGLVYTVNKRGDWAVIDPDDGYRIVKEGTTGTPGAGLGAADVVGDHFCYTTPTWIKCTPLDVAEFGDFHSFRHRQEFYAMGLTGTPDGRAVIWGGEADVWAYDPQTHALEHFAGTGDAPSTEDPATKLIYSKWQFIPHLSDAETYIFAAYNSLDRGVMLFNLPADGPNVDLAPGPEPSPEPELAMDTLECAGSPLIYPTGELPELINLNLQCTVTTAQAEPEPAPGPEPKPEPEPDPEPGVGFPLGPEYGFNVATADFAARCAGAFFCQGFDEDVPHGGKQDEGVSISSGAAGNGGIRPVVHDGVLRTMFPDHSGHGQSGQYFFDFAERLGFEIGPGERLFAQFRMRMSEALAETGFRHTNGGLTKPKLMILSDSGRDSRNSSCTINHFVLTTNNMGPEPGDPRAPFVYNRCRPTQTITQGGPVVGGSRLFDTQPITTTLPHAGGRNPGLPEGESVNRRCWGGDDPAQEGDGYEACWTLPTEQWVTYQVGLTFDSESYTHDPSGREVWNTRVQLWATPDGGATELVVDTIHPYSAADRGLGRVWLLIFMTGKDPAQAHPGAVYADYDELILSRQRIPDPGL